MNMSIKSKLYIGIGLLAGFVVLLWVSGSFFINILAKNSGAIIQDNIRSVTYIKHMQQAINDIYIYQLSEVGNAGGSHKFEADSYKNATQRFEEILGKQEANITETGEQTLNRQLRENYKKLLHIFSPVLHRSPASAEKITQRLSSTYQQIEQNLGQLTTINVDAIHRKNDHAQQTASDVTIYMGLIGGFCSILGIIMVIRFPSYIVDPIYELTKRITDIANHNYEQTLEFHTGDEYEELAAAFNQMATKLQEYENSNLNRIMGEKKRVETIINHMSDAVIGLDAKDYILFINKKAAELIGKPRENLVGQYAPDIASNNHLFLQIYKRLKADNKDDVGYTKIEEEDENEHYYSIEVMPVRRNFAKEVKPEAYLGNIITLKNVTRYHELARAKTNFISVVSHELKTPISSIKMSLRLLNDKRLGKLNEEQKELVSDIAKDIRRMKNTTSDLLDLTKIESGNIQLEIEKVAPADLLQYAFETMETQVKQKELNVELQLRDNLPGIQADPQKTVWVLVNLISNAVRYTDAGGVLSLKAGRFKRGDYVQFSVEDTGEGIASEDLDRIFEKYYQVPKDHQDQSGSGLGLAIAKEFITAQGGQIWAESTLGEGSQFHFTLPIKKHSKG